MENIQDLNDLEFMDKYIENCSRFVNPRYLGEASRRGLIRYLDFLPRNIKDAKAALRIRLSQNEKFWGDPEIDKMSGEINSLKRFKKELDRVKITEVDDLIPILQSMLKKAEYIQGYFKS